MAGQRSPNQGREALDRAPPLPSRRRCAKCAAVRFARLPFVIAAAVCSLAMLPGLCGCSGEIECKSEITDGAASFKGAATGKVENEALRRDAVRDACRQKCGAEKATMIEPCTAVCATDVGAGKIGGKTTCGRK